MGYKAMHLESRYSHIKNWDKNFFVSKLGWEFHVGEVSHNTCDFDINLEIFTQPDLTHKDKLAKQIFLTWTQIFDFPKPIFQNLTRSDPICFTNTPLAHYRQLALY